MLFAYDTQVPDWHAAYAAVAPTGIAGFYIVTPDERPTRVRLMIEGASDAAAGGILERARRALASTA